MAGVTGQGHEGRVRRSRCPALEYGRLSFSLRQHLPPHGSIRCCPDPLSLFLHLLRDERCHGLWSTGPVLFFHLLAPSSPAPLVPSSAAGRRRPGLHGGPPRRRRHGHPVHTHPRRLAPPCLPGQAQWRANNANNGPPTMLSASPALPPPIPSASPSRSAAAVRPAAGRAEAVQAHGPPAGPESPPPCPNH